jgi:hypothetical protein
MTSKFETICSYALADVRKSLWEAVDRRNSRAAKRWTAELVATPGAVGSLWASYWLAWATAQGGPTLPILLKQSWASITAAAHELVNGGGGWPAFRNDPDVRAIASETTTRLLALPRQSPVIWPSKEIILYDVANMRDSPVPAATDGPVVLCVWKRDDDALELRMMAGRFLAHLETGDLRGALSAIAWTLMTTAQQGLNAPMKCAARGPLTKKIGESPLWFWLELGHSYFQSRPHLHKGWITMHNAVAEAFRIHYKRWTTVERMRILLAWTLQIRASMTRQPDSIWAAAPLNQTVEEIDLPYKEIAAELADPNAVIQQKQRAQKEESQKTKSESKMAEADAAVLAALGLSAEDL